MSLSLSVTPIHEDSIHEQCDVLIIGAGLAGLSTALSLPQHLKIVLLAKEDLQACSSYRAQGGIAAVIDTKDSVDKHVSDTLIAGDGLCNLESTTEILSQGATAIEWLLDQQVPFTTECHHEQATTEANSLLAQSAAIGLKDLHLTQEGGHGCRRVIHADDATGRHIMQALHKQALEASHIQVRPYHEALSLVTDNDRCVGAIAVNTNTNRYIQFESQALVLASGGLGQLFSRATAPNVCMGDGIMMAWEAGCRLANLEFIQFHPTGLVYQDQAGNNSDFLISEAVRGEGGYLRCPMTHQRFMPAYDSRAELAPRDIVARAIATEIDNNRFGYVHLDITHQPADFIKAHFPDIYQHCLNLGIDITRDPIPVAPTAHYTCGGVLTTPQGQTDIKGLYAAGEVANTGLHGANRLASNSLLECVVVGRAIAAHLPTYLEDNHHWQLPDCATDPSLLLHAQTVKAHALKAQDLKNQYVNNQYLKNQYLNNQCIKSSQPNTNSSPNCHASHRSVSTNASDSGFNLTALKQLMTDNMGIKRTQGSLQQALDQIDSWRTQLTPSLQQDRLLTLASLLLQAALNRHESRGGHYRHDFPTHSSVPIMSIIAAPSHSP